MSNALKYLLLIACGFLFFFIISLFQLEVAVNAQEYYYSTLAKNSYTILSATLLVFIGMGIGYFSKLRPLLAGFCMVSVFPLISIGESILFRGSHNLIPFEFILYFFFSIPPVTGIYIGRFINKRVLQAKAN